MRWLAPRYPSFPSMHHPQASSTFQDPTRTCPNARPAGKAIARLARQAGALRALLALLLAGPFLGACSAPRVSAAPFIASLSLGGDLSITDNSNSFGSGTTNSTYDQLGVGDNEAAIGGVVRLGLGGAELSLAALGVDLSGTGTTQSEFDFNGQTIAANSEVNTDIDLRLVRGLLTWDLIPIAGVDLGIGIGATVIDLDFDLRSTDGSNRVQTNQLLPVPLIGARAAWTWGPVALRADVGGLVIKYDGNEAIVLDGEVSASLNFFDIGDLAVGYRSTRIDAVYDDDDARVDTDLDLEGFYFGLQFGF